MARCIICCFKCCLWCLEKFIKFLNRNAYIMIAIYGKNFCVSAKNAFMLLMRNVLRSDRHAPVGSPTHFSHPKAGLRNVLCLVQYHAITCQHPHPSLS